MKALAGVILIVVAAAGCFGPERLTEEQKLNSSAGVERTQAVMAIGERNDRAKIPILINRLEDNDDAVRLAAINSLQKMTGKDFGYVPYDDERTRRAAVAKWREWWKKEGAATDGKRGQSRTAGQSPNSGQSPVTGGKP